MISLLKNDALGYLPKISFMQTACLKEAFDGSALSPDIWVQGVSGRTSAVISRMGGRLNITADGADLDELKEFINVIGFSEIFTEKQTALDLGFRNFEDFTVFKKVSNGTDTKTAEISLSALYNALKEGADGDIFLPPFEVFAPDVSHRLRHGGATAAVENFGGALAFTSEFGGIISGIAVKKEARGKGKGKKLLNDICQSIGGDIFACTRGKTAEFYIKNGFEPCGSAVLIRG